MIALPLYRTRSRLEQEVGSECAKQCTVTRVSEQSLLVVSKAKLKVEREIDVGIKWVLALTGIRWLGAITPLGGLFLLAGWLLLGAAAWRR